MATEIIETTNFVAQQSDRWIFIGLLVIGLVFASLLFKYLVGQIDELRTRMDAQSEDFVEHLKQANKDMLEVVSTAHKTIAQNTSIMERVERRLEAHNK